MEVEGWLAVGAGVLALVANGLVAILWRRQSRQHTVSTQLHHRHRNAGRPLIAFVVNPTKPDLPALRRQVGAACAGRYLPEPIWLETTVADPGAGQARQALAQGADIVVAVGGDGTVRAVAEALVGTGCPMGLIPLGTGNLLARNVDIPLTDPSAALDVVLDGQDKPVDVGRVRVLRWGPDGGDGTDHIFLVIAGLGFDAAMVASTDDQLKAKVGWVAYFLGGIQHLHSRRTKVRVRLEDGEPITARVRSVLIGNCGRLPGGFTLLPDAVLDDGWLDVAAIDTRGGLAGWVQLFGEVVLQGTSIRSELPAKIGRIDHARAQMIRVSVHGSAIVQVDGDIVGDVSALKAWVDPGALLLRVP